MFSLDEQVQHASFENVGGERLWYVLSREASTKDTWLPPCGNIAYLPIAFPCVQQFFGPATFYVLRATF